MLKMCMLMVVSLADKWGQLPLKLPYAKTPKANFMQPLSPYKVVLCGANVIHSGACWSQSELGKGQVTKGRRPIMHACKAGAGMT